jgi:hypothetical protein
VLKEEGAKVHARYQALAEEEAKRAAEAQKKAAEAFGVAPAGFEWGGLH